MSAHESAASPPTNEPEPSPPPSPSLEGLLGDDKNQRPATIRHISAPALQSPLRHHIKRPLPKRHVKETLNARSEYSNSEDDGTAEHRINQYLVKQEIGRGSFGSVHLAVDQFGCEYAVKEFSKSRLRKRAQSNLLRLTRAAAVSRRAAAQHQPVGASFNSPMYRPSPENSNSLHLIKEEIAIMKKLDHPNVVSLIEVLDDPTEDSLYMVLEMCKKGVVMKVGLDQTADPYDLERTRHLFRDMILGIEYLHAQGIIHRDIKPDNCLVTDNDVLKIVDFGVSEMFSKENSEMTTKKSAGSPAFMPPELCTVRHGEVSGRAVDIWSMGVTLYCLAFGHIPFERTVIVELYESIKHDNLHVPEGCDPQLKNLLQRLLDKDPAKRIEMDDIRVSLSRFLVEVLTNIDNGFTLGSRGMERTVFSMKAVKKFQGLIEHKRPGFLQGMFGQDPIVQPPILLEHKVSRTHSDSLYNRQAREGTLATEGIHRNLKFNDDLTSIEKHVDKPDGEKEAIHITQHSQWRPARQQGKEAREKQSQSESLPMSDSHPSEAPESKDREQLKKISSRSETGKGQAHDPLEDLLFLSIGSSSEAPEQDPGDNPIVSESPGAVDIDVYAKAYEDEIQRILAAKAQGTRPTLYLTKRVEGTKHLRENKAITDFSRAATTASAAIGFTKLAEKAKSHVIAQRQKACDSDDDEDAPKSIMSAMHQTRMQEKADGDDGK